MKQVKMPNRNSSEKGSSGVKLLIAGVVILTLAYAGYNYIPVAYQGQSFSESVESAVIKGFSLPANKGKPKKLVAEKINRAIIENEVPADTYVDVKENGNSVTARVYYKKEVSILPFGLFNYEYVFDVTVTPDGFLSP